MAVWKERMPPFQVDSNRSAYFAIPENLRTLTRLGMSFSGQTVQKLFDYFTKQSSKFVLVVPVMSPIDDDDDDRTPVKKKKQTVKQRQAEAQKARRAAKKAEQEAEKTAQELATTKRARAQSAEKTSPATKRQKSRLRHSLEVSQMKVEGTKKQESKIGIKKEKWVPLPKPEGRTFDSSEDVDLESKGSSDEETECSSEEGKGSSKGAEDSNDSDSELPHLQALGATTRNHGKRVIGQYKN
jgi:hypothetical protein